jgi:tRNA1Val (adenine37-N6)-methyltransferase
LVLIEAAKDGGSFLKVEAPVVVFRAPGEYSPEIREVYGY